MPTRPEPIGLIGLGAMGMPIAERLLAGGHPVVAYDLDEARLALLGNHVTRARSAADVADQARIVIGCVATLDAFRASVLGEEGLVKGRRIERYVHFGTTGARFLRELSEPLKARGIETVDAPVTGGVPRAKLGGLTVIVSGPKAAREECDQVFRSYGNTVICVGDEPGQAQTVKLINNMLSAGNLALACEALTLGVKAGIAPEMVLDVVNHGTGQSDASLTKLPRHVLTRGFDYGGSLQITLKDTAAYAEAAAGLGVSSLIATAVRQAYLDAAGAGHADADMTAIALHYEALAGLD